MMHHAVCALVGRCSHVAAGGTGLREPCSLHSHTVYTSCLVILYTTLYYILLLHLYITYMLVYIIKVFYMFIKCILLYVILYD